MYVMCTRHDSCMSCVGDMTHVCHVYETCIGILSTVLQVLTPLYYMTLLADNVLTTLSLLYYIISTLLHYWYFITRTDVLMSTEIIILTYIALLQK